MNTLWQRLGRAARGDGKYAFAILLAEKDYFDEERELKEKRANQPSWKRKRKGKGKDIPAKESTVAARSGPTPAAMAGPAASHPAPDVSTVADSQDAMDIDLGGDTRDDSDVEMPDDGEHMDEDDPGDLSQGEGEAEGDADEDEANEAAADSPTQAADNGARSSVAAGEAEGSQEDRAALMEEERRELYNKRPPKAAAAALTARVASRREISPVLDDFINAKRRGFGCRRKVVTLYYSNDKRGKFSGVHAIVTWD